MLIEVLKLARKSFEIKSCYTLIFLVFQFHDTRIQEIFRNICILIVLSWLSLIFVRIKYILKLYMQMIHMYTVYDIQRELGDIYLVST